MALQNFETVLRTCLRFKYWTFGVVVKANNSILGKTQKHVVVTCLDCGTIKRFPTKANYQLWMDRTDAWVTDQSQQKQQQPVAKKHQRNDSSRTVHQQADRQEDGQTLKEINQQQAEHHKLAASDTHAGVSSGSWGWKWQVIFFLGGRALTG